MILWIGCDYVFWENIRGLWWEREGLEEEVLLELKCEGWGVINLLKGGKNIVFL